MIQVVIIETGHDVGLRIAAFLNLTYRSLINDHSLPPLSCWCYNHPFTWKSTRNYSSSLRIWLLFYRFYCIWNYLQLFFLVSISVVLEKFNLYLLVALIKEVLAEIARVWYVFIAFNFIKYFLVCKAVLRRTTLITELTFDHLFL